jgi:transcriptional regulator with PAS, ATPase and Fis domain
VVTVTMPPLRERSGDIVPLATHFLDFYSAKFGKACGPLTPAALEALEACRWDGNVRQLQHCIERAVALHTSGPIDTLHLFPAGNLAAGIPATTDPAAALGIRMRGPISSATTFASCWPPPEATCQKPPA